MRRRWLGPWRLVLGSWCVRPFEPLFPRAMGVDIWWEKLRPEYATLYIGQRV